MIDKKVNTPVTNIAGADGSIIVVPLPKPLEEINDG